MSSMTSFLKSHGKGRFQEKPKSGFSSYDEEELTDHRSEMEKFKESNGSQAEEYTFVFKNDDGTSETIKLRFDKVAHEYTRLTLVDGMAKWIIVPGVTTILGIKDKSQVLMPWAVNETVSYVKADFLDLDPEQLSTIMQDPLHLQEWLFTTLDEAKKNYREASKTATDIGKEAHDWLEKYVLAKIAGNDGLLVELEDQRAKMDERAISCCEAALDWMRKHNVRWMFTERKVYSRKFDIAGTLDGVCHVDSCDDPECCPRFFRDVLSIIDWKSSNALYDTYRWQGAPYKHALKEELDLDVQHIWVIQLGKYDGAFKKWHIWEDDYEMDLACFVALLQAVRTTEFCTQTLRARNAAARAAKKAAREAAEAAEKAERLRIRTEKKEARAYRAEVYRQHRANKHSVVESNLCADAWLTKRLAEIGGADDEDALEEAA